MIKEKKKRKYQKEPKKLNGKLFIKERKEHKFRKERKFFNWYNYNLEVHLRTSSSRLVFRIKEKIRKTKK